MAEKDEFTRRREARQRKAAKKRRKRLFFFTLFLIIAIGVTLSLTVLFPIKKVRSSGSKIYTEKEIVAAADIYGKNEFTVSSSKTETAIREKLPFVGSVTLERYLPDGILIKVKDASEYTCYASGGKYYSVSKDGYVLKEYQTAPDGLLTVTCSEVTCKTGRKIVIKSESEKELISTLLAALENKDIETQSIDVSSTVAVKATVCGRFKVNFGTTAYLDKKINHLSSMINNIGEERRGSIDLSMWTPTKTEGSFTAEQ